MFETYSRKLYCLEQWCGAVRDASEDDAREMKGIEREREREVLRQKENSEGGKGAEVVSVGWFYAYLARSVQTPTGNNYLDPYIYLHVIMLHPRLASSSRDLINM